MFPLWDDNLVLSFHKYWNNNDVRSIQHILDARNKNNVPVWLGETGENSNTWFTDAVILFESNNIGWSWWPLKKLGNNNPLQIRSNDNYMQLVNYWNGKAKEQPSKEIAVNGLMEFAKSTNIHSNIIHRDVIDALFRQPYSDKAIPFKQNIISEKESLINAADYDLGKNNIAYFDKDTGNYYISSGGRNAGNKGYTYRNDGVDIYEDSLAKKTYYVSNIEDSEWVQYTLDVTLTGTYALQLKLAANETGTITVSADCEEMINKKEIVPTGSLTNCQAQTIGNVHFSKGQHVLRVYFDKGRFNVKQLVFNKQD
jgi:hypothetical protein